MLTDRYHTFSRAAGIFTLMLLGACATPPIPEAPQVVPAVDQSQAESEEAVATLLLAAEKALSADRLMSPLHDNAYDRYRAVLLLRPDNAQAITGLQQVFLRYIALARAAIAKSRWSNAKTYLRRADIISPNHELIKGVKKTLLDQRAKAEASAEREAPEEGVYRLDNAQVAKRDPAVMQTLKLVAERMRDSGETMMIVAKTDADGRWIYGQMKAAVPGFRLRGDIRLGGKTRIKLRAPIEVPLQ